MNFIIDYIDTFNYTFTKNFNDIIKTTVNNFFPSLNEIDNN